MAVGRNVGAGDGGGDGKSRRTALTVTGPRLTDGWISPAADAGDSARRPFFKGFTWIAPDRSQVQTDGRNGNVPELIRRRSRERETLTRQRRSTTKMHITMHLAFAAIIGFAISEARQQQHDIAYYIHPCQKSGSNVNECLTYAANHLAMHLRKGIPELGIEEVEPIVIDEINLALGSGPDGYRATFKDIQAYGVSNLTVNQVRSDLNSLQFQLTFSIPKISATAHYRSSGVLIMVQATGGGEYWGEYEGVKAKVYIKASEVEHNSQRFLHLEDLKMDFSVKDIQMGIKNVHNGNAVLEAALNLFINSNSQELLKEMKPHIKKKLLVTMKSFIDNLFSRVPYDHWIID